MALHSLSFSTPQLILFDAHVKGLSKEYVIRHRVAILNVLGVLYWHQNQNCVPNFITIGWGTGLENSMAKFDPDILVN